MVLGRPPRYWLAALALLPMLVWWLGWYPGFASSDTIDQWSQGVTGDYRNNHPPVHTFYLWVMSLGGTRPGLVTLMQILTLTGLLVYATRRLIEARVPAWLSVGAAWLLGLAPAIAPTTLALWKDVLFGLFMLWAWVELLGLAVRPERWEKKAPWARLGIAVAGIWVLRGNGPITVLLILAVLVWARREYLRQLVVTVGALAVVVLLVAFPLGAVLEARGPGIDPAQVFLPDIAASLNHRPDSFTGEDIVLIEALAPPRVWTERYDCYDSTPLLFDPAFDHEPVRESPGDYRRLVLAVATRDTGSVIAHRVCAADFVFSPPQPAAAYFHRPPYDIPANDVGLSRRPISDRAFTVTDRVWRWAEENLWLAWRPAIVILPALAAVVVFAVVPAGRRFLLPSSLLLAHVANVAATSPAQEFRYAYPLYLMALLTLPLLAPTLRGGRGSP